MAQILVVDDSSTVRNEVGDFLKKNGLEVLLAVDGRDGLGSFSKIEHLQRQEHQNAKDRR